MASAPSNVDLAALMRVRSLELRARLVMEGFWKGMHRSPLHGFSAEFSEYRQYVVGDDPRFIDWKVMARSDRSYVKKFEEETNLRCQLLLDASSSMAYGSAGFSKLDYAATLGATLGLFLKEQGDAAGLTVFDEKIRDHLPAQARSGQWHALLVNLQKAVSSPVAGGPRLPLRPLGEMIRRRALLVLMSDFLMPLNGLDQDLGLLGAMQHDVVVFHLMDPAELDFPFTEGAQFTDAETGRQLLLEPMTARASYLKRLNAHLEQLRGICARQGAEYRLIRTDTPLEKDLFDFLHARRHLAARHRAAPRRAA
ncbi:DUF58 domain-containing protein [Verrucomicrobium spinosum]|uniref:DUF58 domain-containing protein n=1 Tax=Verrucomicrobium spinosum TaxID=2736 RepID=UPI0001746AC9|nr:DUF58 domain-containing protein [Verrucomicrobium spinosum]